MRVFNIKKFEDSFVKITDSSALLLRGLISEFLLLRAEKGIDIVSLHETKKTKVLWKSVWIVNKDSASLFCLGERCEPINATHANLCKFRNFSDDSLKRTVDIVRDVCTGVVPRIEHWRVADLPDAPVGMKYTSAVGPEDSDYPVLVLGNFRYCSLDYDYRELQSDMVVLAYDSMDRPVLFWQARGVCRVARICDRGNGEVAFVGEGGEAVFRLAELRVTGPNRHNLGPVPPIFSQTFGWLTLTE